MLFSANAYYRGRITPLNHETGGPMPTTITGCPCGLPLHYASAASRQAIEDIIAEYGENIRVAFGGQGYLVPRHYIALHGLAAIDLDALATRYGWPRD